VTLSDGGGSFDLPADNNGIYGPSNSLTTNHVVTSNSNNLTFSMQGSDVFRIEGAGANYFSFDAAGDITANALGVFKGFGATGVELGDTGENITLNAATGHSTIEADNDIVLDASNIRIIHDPVDDIRNTHVLAINATSRNLEEVPISHFGESTSASNGVTMNSSIVQLGGNLFQPTDIQIDNLDEDYLLISSNQELFPAPGRQLRIHNSFVGDHSLGEWSSAGIELMAESDETTGPNRQTFLRLYTKVSDDGGTADEIMSYVNATDGLALTGDSVFITVDTFAKINKNLIVQGQYYTELHTETDGATVTFDFDDGNVQEVTLAGNRTFAFTNAKPGGRYMVKITQDATGSRTVTWPGNIKWSGGSAPTLTTTAGKTDIVSLMYDGTDFYATCSKNF
jgi:hypothetical protein